MWWPFKKKTEVGSICGELHVRDKSESGAFDIVPKLWNRTGYTLKREFVKMTAEKAAERIGMARGVPISTLVFRDEAWSAMYGAWAVEFFCGDHMIKLHFGDNNDFLFFEASSLYPLIRIGESVDEWVQENIDSMKSQQNMERHVEVAASIQRINNFAARGV